MSDTIRTLLAAAGQPGGTAAGPTPIAACGGCHRLCEWRSRQPGAAQPLYESRRISGISTS